MQIIKKSNLELGDLLFPRRVGRRLSFGALGVRDRAALVIATCGIGFIPLTPATLGSALGVFMYLLIGSAVTQLHTSATTLGWNPPSLAVEHFGAMIIAILVVSLAGIWAASRAEKVLEQEDPRPVVIDEVAGQLLTFLFLPFMPALWELALGFVLFRALDVLKPYPAHRLESLRSGLGIMSDDLMAGLYAGFSLWLAATLSQFL